MFTLLALLLTCQTAEGLSSSSLPSQAAKMTTDPNDLKPILSHALPGIISYEHVGDGVKQANAEGSRILSRHSSSLSEKYDDECDKDAILETELFLKRVAAKAYTHKSWTDMRRTLVYARTEVRFYNEIVPLLLASNDDMLRRQIPKCFHATYDLSGLIEEDSLTTDASQPSPLPEDEEQLNALLATKGGHMLLESLSPSHGYYQDSPITIQQSLACLTAVAELHASAWGDKPLLKQINDRLSSAGGSYHLQFRNPKELQNMVSSWELFRGNFVGLNEKTKILEKESVVRLGQRVYDMAEYVSKELTPKWDDEYATLVHGDYKAMNVFLPSDDAADDKPPIMIDFSCAGIGYGISDVGMHICHANLAEDLENGGEEELLEGYLTALEEAVSRRKGESWTYPRDVALRHYQLACIDYLRFILGRFWRTATPESFEKKKASKNTTLINRNVDAAMAFIEKVDKYLEVFEQEIKA
mmetsp:Transcript_1093/g.1373  ORF Transcript_1093/g.1373 Transcript_1093/m.1373 type:complete len:472 (-) Transcript_1093:450-1865(-)